MQSSSSKNEQADWELMPCGMLVHRREGDDQNGHCEPLIKINVSHGPSQHELHLPPQSTFGYMKEVLEQKIGVEPARQKILFRGQEKEDDEYLREAGVKDKSKVLVLEDPMSREMKLDEVKESEGTPDAEVKESKEMLEVEMMGNEGMPELEMKQTEAMSKAFQALAEVRVEVDKLGERVAAVEVAVNGGTKIVDEEFVVSSELLMRQLLKLDTIEAEGEAKMQRKAEVRRVQNFHDMLDNLKEKNSRSFSNSDNTVSITTEWETFDSGVGSLNPPPQVSSSTRITQDWERFD